MGIELNHANRSRPWRLRAGSATAPYGRRRSIWARCRRHGSVIEDAPGSCRCSSVMSSGLTGASPISAIIADLIGLDVAQGRDARWRISRDISLYLGGAVAGAGSEVDAHDRTARRPGRCRVRLGNIAHRSVRMKVATSGEARHDRGVNRFECHRSTLTCVHPFRLSRAFCGVAMVRCVPPSMTSIWHR